MEMGMDYLLYNGFYFSWVLEAASFFHWPVCARRETLHYQFCQNLSTVRRVSTAARKVKWIEWILERMRYLNKRVSLGMDPGFGWNLLQTVVESGQL
jgi:hypothetical protein